MKKILLLIAGLTIFSCKTEPKIEYAILSGKIEKPTGKNIKILNENFEKEILLKQDGTFRDTLTLESGYYTLDHGRDLTYVYLQPGDDISVTLNAREFDESITYKGIGAAQNNYLAIKTLESENFNYQTVYKAEEKAFLKIITDLKTRALKKLANTKDLDPEFVKLEKQNIEYEFLANLVRYPSYHPYYTKKQNFKASEDLLAPLKNIDFDNEESFRNFEAYRQVVLQHYMEKFYNDDTKEASIPLIKGVKSQNIKDALAKDLAYAISPSGEHSETVFNTIKEISSDEKFIREVTKKYHKLQDLAAGKDSPEFKYENYVGGTTSLADLQGKYVYIDVWATWCGPCIGEIPSLKKVEHQYHDKNIAFVSISIDEKNAYNKWKDMIKNRELGGIQLMADNAWQSQFVKDYAIEGIPRFILIDPNGKIVNADAPRPSNPKLIELFNELKI